MNLGVLIGYAASGFWVTVERSAPDERLVYMERESAASTPEEVADLIREAALTVLRPLPSPVP